MQRFLKISVILGLLTFFSCQCAYAIFGFNRPKPQPKLISTHSPDEYLQLASTALSPQQQHFQLLAVRRLLQDHQLARASQILSTIQPPPNAPNLIIRKQLLTAKIQLANKFDNAIQTLQRITLDEKTNLHNRISYHETLALAYAEQKNILNSIEQRNMLTPLLLSDEQRLANYKEIWATIEHLSTTELNIILNQPLPGIIRGWLELAMISQQLNQSNTEFGHNIIAWRRKYPKHPGNSVLPRQIRYSMIQEPHNIYLLLPLHGKFGKNGQAIKDGFMTAYYQHKPQLDHPIQVHVMDTSSRDISSIYDEAVGNNADFIVGPLTKANIHRLISTQRLSVPTLVLNQINISSRKNLYQFGLSQQQEAAQIADRAKKDGHQKAIILAPTGEWGQSIADEFQTHWQQLGGDITDSMAFHDTNQLAQQIRELLHVNKSESRASDLKKLLQQDLRFVPRRRQDVDFIFLVATPTQAKTIPPMLKFYFAGDLPIYATSLVHNSFKKTEIDLDNILFAQMPWLTGELPHDLQLMQQQAFELWPKKSQQEPKFFALGIDAYQLSHDLSRLSIFPQHGIVGATGTLYLLPNQKIYRRLKWAEIKHGHISTMH